MLRGAAAVAVVALVLSCKPGDDGIVVSSGIATISVQPATVTLAPGATMQLTATARDAEENPLSGVSVTWASDNNAIANVTAGGVVTAVNPGTASISATASGKTGSARVTVALPQVNIATSASPANAGTTTGGGNYSVGSAATVTATPNSGFQFTNWTENGAQVSTSASYTFTVAAARTLVANFATVTHVITASVSPANAGTITGAGTFAANASATLIATANNGFQFVNWTESGAQVSTSASYTFTVTTARTLVANFVAANFTLTVTASGTGNGTVTAPAAGGQAAIACTVTSGVASGTCGGTYPSGTIVALVAAPTGSGGGGFTTQAIGGIGGASSFSGWGGACAGTTDCSVGMTQNRTVTATFAVAALGDGCTATNIAFPSVIAGTITNASCIIDGARAASYRFTASGAGGSTFSLAAAFPAILDVSTDPAGTNVALVGIVDPGSVAGEWLLPAGTFRVRVRARTSTGAFTLTGSTTSGTSAGCPQFPFRMLVTSGTYTGQALAVGDCLQPDATLSDNFLIRTTKPCTITMTPTGFNAFLGVVDLATGVILAIANNNGANVAETINLNACSSGSNPIAIVTNAFAVGEVGAYTLTVTVTGGGSLMENELPAAQALEAAVFKRIPDLSRAKKR